MVASNSKIVKLDDGMSVYVATPSSKPTKKVGILVSYDIFGFEVSGTRDFCNRLAEETGYVVVFGDYFRGNAWSMSNYPPQDIMAFMMWEIGFTEEQLMSDMDSLKAYMKKDHGVTSVGLLGFGYGGKVSICGSKTGEYQAVAILHGDFIHESDAPEIRCPVLMVDAGEDADHCHFEKIIKAHPTYGPKSEFVRFNDQHHGCINRGDKTDKTVKKGMDQAFAKAKTFFQGCLE